MSPTVELGRLPPEELLPPLPLISSNAEIPSSSGARVTVVDSLSAAGSLMSLLVPQSELEASKLPKVWVSDGLPAIPRTYEKILWWEFVDMAELQPVGELEKLSAEPDPHRFVSLPGLEVAQARKKPTRDVLTWVQCFNIYIAVVVKKHPDMVPEMLAYMLIVLRAQRDYKEAVWHLYDEAFRDKAAATGNRKWSQIDTHIYNQIFTGRARKRVLCTHCSMATHETEECPAVQPRRKRRVEEANFGRLEEIPKGRKGICWDFNDGACRYGDKCGYKRKGICWDFNDGACRYGDKCGFRHICSECAGRHPRVSCRRASAPKKGLTSLGGGPL